MSPHVSSKPEEPIRQIQPLGQDDNGLFKEWNLELITVKPHTEEYLSNHPKMIYVFTGHGGIQIEQYLETPLHGPLAKGDSLILTTEGKSEYEAKIKTGPHAMEILVQHHSEHHLTTLYAMFAVQTFAKSPIESHGGIKKGVLLDPSNKINFLEVEAAFNPMTSFSHRWLEVHLEPGETLGENGGNPTFLYVLEGKGTLDLKDALYSFEFGDYTRIPGSKPYVIQNCGSTILKVLMIQKI